MTLASHAGGPGFESLRAHHNYHRSQMSSSRLVAGELGGPSRMIASRITSGAAPCVIFRVEIV